METKQKKNQRSLYIVQLGAGVGANAKGGKNKKDRLNQIKTK